MNKQVTVCPQLLSYSNELGVNLIASAKGPGASSTPHGHCLTIKRIKGVGGEASNLY